jgi:hypothetical protein
MVTYLGTGLNGPKEPTIAMETAGIEPASAMA